MTLKQSESRKNYWKKISKEERSKRGSVSALKGWAKVSKEERHRRAMRMVHARTEKVIDVTSKKKRSSEELKKKGTGFEQS